MESFKSSPIVFLIISSIIAVGCSTIGNHAQSGQPAAEKVASAYGIEHFSEIKAIRYTFNVQIENKIIQREWIWEPQPDTVTFKGKNSAGKLIEHSYTRPQTDLTKSGLNQTIDKWFINDQYWLLFPFHLKWDSNIKITVDGKQPLPIPPGKAERITVTYPPNIGYTPGDIYELYLGKDYLLDQWIYRKGGAAEPTRIVTWEKHSWVGPIVVSLEHKSPDGKFRQWFSEVAVKMVGSDRWLAPVALNR